MKAKMIIVLTLGCMIVFSLAGCSKTPVNPIETEESQSETQELTEESQSETQELTEDTQKEVVLQEEDYKLLQQIDLNNQDMQIESVMYPFAELLMIRYARTGNVGTVNGLTDDLAVSIAAIHCNRYNGFGKLEDATMNERFFAKILDRTLVAQSMRDLYGKEYSVDNYMNANVVEQGIEIQGSNLLVGDGEWGTEDIDFKITNKKTQGTQVIVTAQCIVTDETDAVVRYLANVEATLEKNENSQYGYIIKNIVMK